MKAIGIRFVIDVFSKGLVQGLEDMEFRGQVKTILTTTLLGLAWILRVLETGGD